MREIEFLGKQPSTMEWVYGYLFVNGSGDTLIKDKKERHGVTLIDPETVGQYTGLLDCNGRKVYEGDIVEIYNATTNPAFVITAKIYFERGSFWFTGSGRTDCNWHFYDSKDIKVIGNIHDNPELLEAV